MFAVLTWILAIIVGAVVGTFIGKAAWRAVEAANKRTELKRAQSIVIGSTYEMIRKTETNPWDEPDICRVKVVDVKDTWVRYVFFDKQGKVLDYSPACYQSCRSEVFLNVYSYVGDTP